MNHAREPRDDVDEIIDLADELENLLLSVGNDLYSRDHEVLINTAAAIKYGGLRTLSIDLPTRSSEKAECIAKRVKSFPEGSARVAEWALRQGWADLAPEASIKAFGKADIFVKSQGIIIEVGDCRIDKPFVGTRLGYAVMVVPVEPMCLFDGGHLADAIMFLPGIRSEVFDLITVPKVASS